MTEQPLADTAAVETPPVETPAAQTPAAQSPVSAPSTSLPQLEDVEEAMRDVVDPELGINVVAVSYTHLTLPTNREV